MDNIQQEDRRRRFPEDFINKIIQGDAVSVLKELPDKSIDVVLTDPPYGVGINYGEYYEDTQENLKKLIDAFMPEALRVGKVVVLTPGIVNLYSYPKPDWIMAWVVPAGTAKGAWGFNCWQPILCYGKDPRIVKKSGRQPDIIIDGSGRDKAKFNTHPVPKPLQFWLRLLKRVSVEENEIILDPFVGSGTTAVACKIMHRRYIGVDINPDYVQIAEKRLKDLDGELFKYDWIFEEGRLF